MTVRVIAKEWRTVAGGSRGSNALGVGGFVGGLHRTRQWRRLRRRHVGLLRAFFSGAGSHGEGVSDVTRTDGRLAAPATPTGGTDAVETSTSRFNGQKVDRMSPSVKAIR